MTFWGKNKGTTNLNKLKSHQKNKAHQVMRVDQGNATAFSLSLAPWNKRETAHKQGIKLNKIVQNLVCRGASASRIFTHFSSLFSFSFDNFH